MKSILLEGFINGMEKNGCKFIKAEGDKIYFDIPQRLSGEGMKNAKALFSSQQLRLFTRVNSKLR